MKAILVLAVSVVALACESKEKENGTSPSLPSTGELTVLHTSRGDYVSELPATLDVYWGTEPHAQFAASGLKGDEVLSVVARWQTEGLSSTAMTANVSSGALADSVANVILRSQTSILQMAEDGVFSASFTQGHVTGDVATSTSSELEMQLEGRMLVVCSVPRSVLGTTSGTTADEPAAEEPLVIDQKFETSLCAPFKNW